MSPELVSQISAGTNPNCRHVDMKKLFRAFKNYYVSFLDKKLEEYEAISTILIKQLASSHKVDLNVANPLIEGDMKERIIAQIILIISVNKLNGKVKNVD